MNSINKIKTTKQKIYIYKNSLNKNNFKFEASDILRISI